MKRSQSVAFENISGFVGVDHDSPDKQAARREAMHEADDDFDQDFAPCDGGESIDVDGIRGIPRDALQRLVLFLIPPNSTPGKRWRIAQLRLAVIAQMVDADGIGKLSFEDLGKQLGCTRALLSYHSLKMIDSLGIDKLANSKQRRTREIYREAAIKSHRARGNNVASDGEQDHSATK